MSSADIAPTLLDLAQAPPLCRAQGRSLRPIMEENGAPWREAILIEEDQPFGIGTLEGPVRIRTVVTRDLRLTRIVGSRCTELFDLGLDPGEQVNIVDSPEAAELLSRATTLMLDELMSVADESVVPFHAA